MGEYEPSNELMELAFLALDHGVDSVKEGGPLIPFAIVETDEGRQLARFAAETLEESLEQTRRHVRGTADAARVAIAYDGYLTIEGERTDAVYVEAQERGEPVSIVMAQRYRPGGRLRKFSTIGNPAFLSTGEPLL